VKVLYTFSDFMGLFFASPDSAYVEFLNRQGGPASDLFYEKHLVSLPALTRELGLLDGDAGVRVIGRYGGVKCFAFVTRFRSEYTVVVYSTKAGSPRTPGRKLASREFDSIQGLVSFLKSIVGKKIEAYAY
jgi:hypothetical protein